MRFFSNIILIMRFFSRARTGSKIPQYCNLSVNLSFHVFGSREDLAGRFVLTSERLICPPLLLVADGVGGLNKANQMLRYNRKPNLIFHIW